MFSHYRMLYQTLCFEHDKIGSLKNKRKKVNTDLVFFSFSWINDLTAARLAVTVNKSFKKQSRK